MLQVAQSTIQQNLCNIHDSLEEATDIRGNRRWCQLTTTNGESVELHHPDPLVAADMVMVWELEVQYHIHHLTCLTLNSGEEMIIRLHEGGFYINELTVNYKKGNQMEL